MLKWKLVLLIFVILIVLGACSSNESNSNVTTTTTNSSHSEEVKEGFIRVTVSMDNGSQYITEEEISIDEGKSLLDVMISNFFIEQSNGKITSIERVKASKDENTEWKYFVNGEEIDVIPRDYIPASGDKIVFDLQPIASDKIEMEEDSSAEEEVKLDHRILQTIDENSTIVYAAIPDDQFQYVIPISFVISGKSQNEAYNELEQYLKDSNLIDNHYLLDGLSYEILKDEKQVRIQFPDDFTIQSSAEAYMFEKLLSMMFMPIGIEKVIFDSVPDKEIVLGPFGDIDELNLNKDKSSYKLYNDSYFISIPHDELSIEDAILNLKEDQSEFNVHHTIPDEINFNVVSENNKLSLEYSGPSELHDLQAIVTMIESILTTAKSYGYEYVNFKNMPLEQVGNYLLTDEIKVPIAVNPINIK